MRVYNDRITLWNPGGLPIGLTIEDLYEEHSSQPRNKLLANAFFKAGFIETWGRGINTWVPFTSQDNPDAKLNAFRGFFLSDAPANAPAAAPALAPIATGPKQYRTLFNNAGAGTVSDGNVPDAFNILYNPDIPTPTSETSGVEPIIHTIDADGTHHYFDLLGRPLNHKPEQGIYIDNGKKVIVK